MLLREFGRAFRGEKVEDVKRGRHSQRWDRFLPRGSAVIMNNASFHPKQKLENLVHRHGLKLLFLPPHSPDFNPIEKTRANMKRAFPTFCRRLRTLNPPFYPVFKKGIVNSNDHNEHKKNEPKGEKEDISGDVVFEIELIQQMEINIDSIFMLVANYHASNCKNKELRWRLRVQSIPASHVAQTGAPS